MRTTSNIPVVTLTMSNGITAGRTPGIGYVSYRTLVTQHNHLPSDIEYLTALLHWYIGIPLDDIIM